MILFNSSGLLNTIRPISNSFCIQPIGNELFKVITFTDSFCK